VIFRESSVRELAEFENGDEVMRSRRLVGVNRVGHIRLPSGFEAVGIRHTICLAAIATVLMLNFRLHMSNKSSKLGPNKSMTRIL
jgi:hypothetical protein